MRLEDDSAAPITHRVLTQAAEIRGMSVAEAKRGYPVKLRGVITYYNPYNTNLVVQDDSAGIYVRVGNSQVPTLEAGQLIDLDGLHRPRRCRAGDHRAAHQGDWPGAAAGGDADRSGPILRRRRRLPVDGGGRHRRHHRAPRRPHLHRPPPALQADRDGHSRRADAAAGPAPRARQGAGCGRLALQLPPPDARHHAAPAERRLPARRRGRARAAGDDDRRDCCSSRPSTRGDEPSAVQGVVC